MSGSRYYIVLHGAVKGPVSLRWLRYWRDKQRLSGDALIKTSPTGTSRLLDDVLSGSPLLGGSLQEAEAGGPSRFW